MIFLLLISSWLHSFPAATVLLGRDAVSDTNTRSLWDIVSACLTTIFVCTWIAVHSNIPAPEDNAFDILSRRLAIMANLLILPEFVLMWATRQYVASLEICKRHKARGWTKTHAFFAIMGGFALFENGVYVRILEITDLERLESEGMIDWPNITAEEIKDKSKGDYFSKAVVVLQTTWFIVQCIIRGIEKMVVTELEVVTLAFSFLTMVIYFLWWNKPLDVGVPSPVYLRKGYSAKDIFKDSEDSEVVEPEPADAVDSSSFVVTGAAHIGDKGTSAMPEDTNIRQPQQLQRTASLILPSEEYHPLELQDTSSQVVPDTAEKEQPPPAQNSVKIDTDPLTSSIVQQFLLGTDIRIDMEATSDVHKEESAMAPLLSDPQSIPSSDSQPDNSASSSSFISDALSIIFVLLFLPILYVVYSILYSVTKFVLFFSYPILRPFLKVFLKFLYFLFVFLPLESFRAVEDMATCVSLSQKTKRRVPTFYSPNVSDTAGYLVLLAVGIVFGGIHCIAWSFHFPTETERLLWRVTSVVITASPAVILACGLVIPDDDVKDDEAPMQVHTWMVVLLCLIVIIAYIASRLCLIFLPLFSLRALPPGAFLDINWTVFIPHIHT